MIIHVCSSGILYINPEYFCLFPSSQKALNLHHSTLDGRKINVEITCGGGGKGQTRKKKLEERKTKFLRGRKRKLKSTKVIPKSMDNSAGDTNNSDK